MSQICLAFHRIRINGNHAHRVMYTDKKGYDILEVLTIKGDSVYTIRCMAKPHDYSTYLLLPTDN